MIVFQDAFLVLRKWAEEVSRLRFDGRCALYSFSFVGRLESAEPATGIVTLAPSVGTSSVGYMQIHLPPDTLFEYFDPDTMPVSVEARIAESPAVSEGQYILAGSGIIAGKRTSGEQFMFMEIASKVTEA